MCDCERCKLGRRVKALLERLIETDSGRHVETLDDLYSEYVHDSMDHDHLKAIVDNQWPSAEAYMKSKGWVRG
ncbi:hypothetical protein P7_278 [Pectobacterium phage vB_PcaM_P7_Pc]|nr:hypothetical protein P7_278 [Pectobacterium phage vB_PcaM_P7_Pc]